MDTEYKKSISARVIALATSIFLPGLFGWLSYSTLSSEPLEIISLVSLLVFIITVVISFYSIIDAFWSKLIIENDRIMIISFWDKRELFFENVDGMKYEEGKIHFFPKNQSTKKIKISDSYRNKEEWFELLANKTRDLDKEIYQKEKEELFNDQNYGKNLDQRAEKINRTKQITKFLNYCSWGAIIWLLFHPDPYTLATAVNIILPTIGLFLVVANKSLIKIYYDKNSPYPSLSTTLSMPPMALVIRAIIDFNIIDYQNAWRYALILSPLLFLMIIIGTRNQFRAKNKMEELGGYLITALALGFFTFYTSIMINCTYDDSWPEQYAAIVDYKEIEEDNDSPTTYLLTISPWGTIEEQMEVSVSERLYNEVAVGDEVFVNLHQGLLNIPWFL
ncbi:hypothetical protein FNH22_06320 [Fulvivirga sp. M361]|uniref:hypothetical protein n=1 Tax=Fulvivirga sp. M361 TaxID=2594266 RepID=UPI00117B1B02|nr:hypothetical protein [Fulvivirga sp. M361]TRX60656.1 hypothetical protein FNH22_06320 [Fulvivirga sp. M361]